MFKSLKAGKVNQFITYEVISRHHRNKAGLKPVLRPVEQVRYFGGWVEGANCKDPLVPRLCMQPKISPTHTTVQSNMQSPASLSHPTQIRCYHRRVGQGNTFYSSCLSICNKVARLVNK